MQQHINFFILAPFLGVMLSFAGAAFDISQAGPAEDKALRDAAGCIAAAGFNVDGVKTALKSGADPNGLSDDGWPPNTTPLGCTCVVLRSSLPNADLNRRAVEIAKILFTAGAKLGPADRGILFCPIVSGSLDMVRLLIDKGASPTAKLGNYTPAQLARRYNQLAVYEYLLSRGAMPVDNTTAAQMVLIEATEWSDIPTMERAINDGAFINGTDQDDKTALNVAVSRSVYVPNRVAAKASAVAIWWLLDHGADPNQGDRLPPLHTFLIMNHDSPARVSDPPDAAPLAKETLARLLKAGAKVSGRDWRGRTPLHVAAETGNIWAAEYLIALGAKLMARDFEGKTQLDYAESGPMITLLKANGATER